MRRSGLIGLILALLIASPTLAARGGIHGKPGAALLGTAACAAPCIVAPDGVTFGETFGIDFAALDVTLDYWARADCFANASTLGQSLVASGIVYAEYAYLGDRPEVWNDEFFTAGPTPSWWGGGADCTVRLLTIDNGLDNFIATDDFTVLP